MVDHVVIQALQRVIIWPCTDVEQKAVLGFKVLADGLEEPLVRVNLAIISLFNTEHEVYSMAPELLIFNAKVPGRHLEAVQDIARGLFFRHFLVHDVFHLFHGVVLVFVDVHEPFLEENLFIQKALLTS